ncbi:DUF6787 family protein [Anditalea andensis]|uniref:DUF6787 domain-containing protein n=1 Tax=Anditalea andensis TaxID=1048983 RepID=A0A074KZX2_9BACT|nr:DUF6787 family protein [Anditalea andensis]KEO73138.1 hypothetical protein EL17_12320 [Anditalea andensis]
MNKEKIHQKKSYLLKLQTKWGLQNIWQVFLVLLVFACTGMTVMFIKNPLFEALGIDMSTGGFWKNTLYFLFVLPLYQVILLFYGFLFGQFAFFWEKEKRLAKLIRKGFSKNRT